ncbi:cysteine-rich and transmembrane domain-containing protein WIH1 isoform X1 [Dendrobium catenatum]|uniref:cysteine-rich and transmembrane domain-containing protein WIH1 isoform X1 n=1 Tax=Dendrobium catenatum TaxID=906689 RepID=UPI0009F3782A|nr:cysteine-rich and transmembrane domain-containing protein WIH1 isoform X1 [Dendrobium catenatum]
MSSYNQQAAPVEVYPPPQTAYPPPGTGLAYSAPPATVQPPAYSAAPPPGYPVNGAIPYTQQVPVETKQRGDGFWKGCAAALCCCCVLETCCE